MSRFEQALLADTEPDGTQPKKSGVCVPFKARPSVPTRVVAAAVTRPLPSGTRSAQPVRPTAHVTPGVPVRPAARPEQPIQRRTSTATLFVPTARVTPVVPLPVKPAASPVAAHTWTPTPLETQARPAAAVNVTVIADDVEVPPSPQRERRGPVTMRTAPIATAAVAAPAVPASPAVVAPTAAEAPDRLTGFSWSAIPARGRILEKIAAPYSPVALEQYRKLAGILIRAQEAHGVKVIMMASALPSEGKSTTTAALAYTLSNSYRRNVLVIDADLRLSTLHQVFHVQNGAGLSDYLDGRRAGVVAPSEVAPGLTLLTAGRPTNDPVGGLSSPRLRQLVEDASKRFDWILIDTPPVTVLPDANLLTAMVDGVVLVIAAGQTQYPFLTRAVAALGRDRILGAVLNRAANTANLATYYSKDYAAAPAQA